MRKKVGGGVRKEVKFVAFPALYHTQYVRRLRLILNTELNAKNEMQVLETLAMPVLR
jgi:hypothetical protein